MAPSGTSAFTKNGQQVKLPAGSAAITAGDLVSIGGLGTPAWPVATMDYAASANSGTLGANASLAAAAVTGSARQAMARDRLGNIFLAGTNSSGNLVVYKRGPFGNGTVSAVLDAAATSVNTPVMFQLSSGNFACVYARASGALYFVIFDSQLSLIAGPSSIGTERAAANVVYHAACALSGGGFAVVFQTAAGTAINLATYSNAGSAVLSATSVQALTGTPAQEVLRVVQLSSGNLAVGYRGTMSANAFQGTSFTVVAVNGTVVAGPVSVDSVAVFGLLEISALATGGFAVAEGNGTNLLCSVYTDAGVAQGSQFSVANTLNATTYPQVKLTNDGTQFWLAYFTSAGNGLYLARLSSVGAVTATASGLGSGSLTGSTFAFDADVINGMLVVLAASSATAGQFWMAVGLPDASVGASAPYLRAGPTAWGSPAATTGSRWPRVLSGGGGVYRGVSPPANQPTTPSHVGDFTAIFAYDQQNAANTFLGVVKVEASAIVGVALSSVAVGQQGSTFFVNPGQGEYPTNSIGGTAGITFNHLSNNLGGTAGTLYSNGAALSGIATGVTGGSSSPTSGRAGEIVAFGGSAAQLPANALLCYGQLVSRATYATLFAAIGTNWGAGDGSTTFKLPDLRGVALAGLDNMGGTPANKLTNATMTPDGNTIGAAGGAQTVTLTVGQLAKHAHGFSNAPVNTTGGPAAGSQTGNTSALYNTPQTDIAGNDEAHLNVQPTVTTNYMIYFN